MPKDIFAQYPIEIRFPDEGLELYDEAARAIDEEYRNSIKLKRLQCHRVSRVLGPLFAIETDSAIEYDSTWEGALAFRPDEDFNPYINDAEPEEILSSMTWSGEIIEVDEVAGTIYVSVANIQRPPRTGDFYVRPFGFLENLHRVYRHPSFEQLRGKLQGRLRAGLGEVDGSVNGPPGGEFGKLLGGKWSILWGPPGTGKTFSIGRIVASLLDRPEERILIVSTTNRATDEAAISVGRAARNSAWQEMPETDRGDLTRIGKSPGLRRFEEYGLEEMLNGGEPEILHEIDSLEGSGGNLPADERALIRERISALRRQLTDNAMDHFLAPGVKVVIGTAHKALSMLNHKHVRALLAEGKAPFTTVIIDESGLISRTGAAALSLLAARRVLLAGDSKQLAPISRMSRLLPSSQARWIESSALDHLGRTKPPRPGVQLLTEQYRMHPEISLAVSKYQYDGLLKDAPEVTGRGVQPPALFLNQPRTIWYVLDDDAENRAAIRAERGSGNSSWVRHATRAVLQKLFSDRSLREAQGLFLTPFRAQVREIAGYLAAENLTNWSAATVHSRQGSETDIIIFDTVNAGSCAWPYDEWMRLINVGISRAREAVILLSSRAEMHQPYLSPLLETFAPRVLSKPGGSFMEVPPEIVRRRSIEPVGERHLLGSQIGLRKQLRPVFSSEQQRLIGLSLDGKPLLVRGVAGSGKTVVLAHWLVQTAGNPADDQPQKIWAVYANRALEGLILRTIDEASGDLRFPWNRVSLLHIKDILEPRMKSVGLDLGSYDFDWDQAARDYLARNPAIEPCCDALFIDEAQDMGPHTLKLLSAMVRQKDLNDPNSRSINIFYDNAQNIYGRKPPVWADLGLDLRGRSTIMKESFRSTRQITEFALNTLYLLQPPKADEDHRELIRLGLIEKADDWWKVNFNQIEGPKPVLSRFRTIDQEVDAIGEQIVHWIRDEAVNPDDICIIYNGGNLARRIEELIGPKLESIDCRIRVQSSQSYDYDSRTVFATTPHSFKGYDSEIVVIAGVDQFVTREGVLANTLYVAMTRARSLLCLNARDSGTALVSGLLRDLERCIERC